MSWKIYNYIISFHLLVLNPVDKQLIVRNSIQFSTGIFFFPGLEFLTYEDENWNRL